MPAAPRGQHRRGAARMGITTRWCHQLDELPACAWDALHDG
ncbi:GNAT family N-acetyltransferase, partial [Xanthomonas perforans]|nr:GNAT family N-acetyltransferase [Xanthomonas perforans]